MPEDALESFITTVGKQESQLRRLARSQLSTLVPLAVKYSDRLESLAFCEEEDHSTLGGCADGAYRKCRIPYTRAGSK